MKTYVLKPRPPLRAFALGAALSVVGALVAVLSHAQDWGLVGTILGLVLLAAGCALVIAAFVSLRSMQVHVDVDDQGFHVHGPGVDKRKSWQDVTKVSLSADETHLVFAHGEVERTHLFCPGGPGDRQFEALLSDITQRLDRSRGYRNAL